MHEIAASRTPPGRRIRAHSEQCRWHVVGERAGPHKNDRVIRRRCDRAGAAEVVDRIRRCDGVSAVASRVRGFADLENAAAHIVLVPIEKTLDVMAFESVCLGRAPRAG